MSSALQYVDPRYLPPVVRDLVPASIPSLAAAYEFYTGVAPPAGKSWGELLVDAQARQTDAGAFETFSNFASRRTIDFHGFVNQTRVDVLDNLTIRNIFGVGWSRSKGTYFDFDGSDLPLLDSRGILKFGETDPNAGERPWVGGTPTATYTNEFQLRGTLFHHRLSWQTGLYYRDSGSRDWTPTQGALVIFGGASGDPASAAICDSIGVASPCSTLGRNYSKTLAPYAQATFALTPHLNLTAGYRRTWDYRRSETTATSTYFVNFNGFDFPVPVDGRDPLPGARVLKLVVPWKSASSYNLTVDYKINDDLLVYVAHRRGYKGGGINQNLPADDANRAFGPETIKDIEVGLKAQWDFGAVRGVTNIALYQDWYSDIQRSQSVPGQAQVFLTNAADAKIRGLEVDTTIRFSDWLELTGNLSYIDAEYTQWTENKICATQFARPQCAGLSPLTPIVIDHANGILTIGDQVINFTPDPVIDAPKWSLSLQPVLLLEPFIGQDVRISGSINYQSRAAYASAISTSVYAGIPFGTENTIFGPETIPPIIRPAFTRLDLRADWKNIMGSGFRFGIAATNILDKKQTLTSGTAFVNVGTHAAQLSEPRMIWAELGYQF